MSQDEFDEGYGSPTLFYDKFYKSVIFGKGFGANSIRKTHQSMEKPYIGKTYNTVLEIGGVLESILTLLVTNSKTIF